MKYIALHESYGWLQRHWREEEITPDTTETPPESKLLGPLFRPLSPLPVAEKPPVQDDTLGQSSTEKDPRIEWATAKKPKSKVKPKRK